MSKNQKTDDQKRDQVLKAMLSRKPELKKKKVSKKAKGKK